MKPMEIENNAIEAEAYFDNYIDSEEEAKEAAEEAAKEEAYKTRLEKEVEKRRESLRYYRFMGGRELKALIAGKTVENISTHENCKTDSEGFCFLRNDSVTYGAYYNHVAIWDLNEPWKTASEAVGGTCGSDKYFVEFENISTEMKSGSGVYADMTTDEWGALCVTEEYSTHKYSFETLRPIRIWRRQRGRCWEYKLRWEN